MKKDIKTNIQNNTFQGIVWDGKAIEAVNNIAEALLNLTKLFNSQNIHIDTLLTVNTEAEHEKIEI